MLISEALCLLNIRTYCNDYFYHVYSQVNREELYDVIKPFALIGSSCKGMEMSNLTLGEFRGFLTFVSWLVCERR